MRNIAAADISKVSLHNHWNFRDVLYSCWRTVPQHDTPELRLVAAILESGLRAACGCEVGVQPWARERRRAEAMEWILSDDESEYPFTFKACCESLRIDRESVRQAVHNGRLHNMYKSLRCFSD